MAISAPRPCNHPGCGVLVRDGSGRCDKHKRAGSGAFADRNRGTSSERGYGAQWQKIRERILRRDNGLCQECLRGGLLTQVGHKPYTAFCDHIIPKFEGGTDDDDNLQTLCRTCHTTKTDKEKNRGRGR